MRFVTPEQVVIGGEKGSVANRFLSEHTSNHGLWVVANAASRIWLGGERISRFDLYRGAQIASEFVAGYTEEAKTRLEIESQYTEDVDNGVPPRIRLKKYISYVVLGAGNLQKFAPAPLRSVLANGVSFNVLHGAKNANQPFDPVSVLFRKGIASSDSVDGVPMPQFLRDFQSPDLASPPTIR